MIVLTCKGLGNHHSDLYNRKTAIANQLFLGLSENSGHGANHHLKYGEEEDTENHSQDQFTCNRTLWSHKLIEILVGNFD